MRASEVVSGRALRLLCAYFRRPLDAYFANPSNRHIIYYRLGLYFFLTVIGGKILVQQTGFKVNLAFLCIYALHLALTYTMGMLLVDLLLRRCIPGWGSYQNRTVAKQWLLLWLGFGVGFLFHRLVVIHQIGFYVPWFSAYYGTPMALTPNHWQILAFLAPAWFFAAFLAIQTVLIWQRRPANSQPQTHLEGLTLEGPPVPLEDSPASVASAVLATPPGGSVEPSISVNNNGFWTNIPVERITHVTVEDHYCRIHFQDQGRLCNVLLCAPLKGLLDQLPPDTFVQIHRSHLVNLGQVARLKKSGRQYFLGLSLADGELPISRNRWAEIRRRLPGLPLEAGRWK